MNKFLPPILLSATLLASDVTDLGTLTRSRAIRLESGVPDFQCFRLEFMALPSSNTLILHQTNDLITLSNLSTLPSGRIAGAVHVMSRNGEISEPKKIKFYIRRAKPLPPDINIVELGMGTNPPVHESFGWMKSETNLVSPPLPSINTNNIISNFRVYNNIVNVPDMTEVTNHGTNISYRPIPGMGTNVGGPLPGGRSETYQQYLDRLAFPNKRRNE